MWFAVLTVLSDYNRSRSGVVRKTKLLLQIRFPHIFRGDSVPPCAVSVAHDQPGWREFSPVVLPVSTHSGFMFPQYKPLFWKTINFESTGNSDAKNNHEIYISYIPSWRGCGKCVMLGNLIPTPNPLLVVLGHTASPPTFGLRTDYKMRVFTPVHQVAVKVQWSTHVKTGNRQPPEILAFFLCSFFFAFKSFNLFDRCNSFKLPDFQFLLK